MKNVLLTSASGNIGQELLPLLLSLPSQPRLVLPTTNAARLQARIPEEHASRVTISSDGTLIDPRYIEDLLTAHDVDSVFLNITGADELFVVTGFLSAFKRSKSTSPKHLVFLSAFGDFDGEEQVFIGAGAHGSVKLPIERTLSHVYGDKDTAGFTWTVLGPTMFFTNDARQKDVLLGPQGWFTQPCGPVGQSRVDTADIALATVNALSNPVQWANKKIMIGSKKQYTDNDLTELWGKALGKKVGVIQDMEELEEVNLSLFGPTWARHGRLMYETFGKHGFGKFSEKQYQEQVELLGREPASYEDFVEKTAASWKAEA